MITIRSITMADAEEFLQLQQNLDQETPFMLLEPGERKKICKNPRSIVNSFLKSPTSTILVAETSQSLIGFILAKGYQTKRNRHVVNVVIGILQLYTGQGLGQRLFSELETWARQCNITRLQLSVMSHNTNAIKLYQKLQFHHEGIRKCSVCIDGKYYDEWMMAKIIG